MARLDIGWHANPKILRLSAAGMALHAWSISYCDSARSDGFVPDGAWPAKLRTGVKELERGGLYESSDGGYQLHDYTDYNRTRAQIESDQAGARERMRDVRANNTPNNRRTKTRTNGVPLAGLGDPDPGDARGEASMASTPSPTPSPEPDGWPNEAAPLAAVSPHGQALADAMEKLYGPPIRPERLPNGAQQCPLCPDIFMGSYAEHLESPRHKIHDQPADLRGLRG